MSDNTDPNTASTVLRVGARNKNRSCAYPEKAYEYSRAIRVSLYAKRTVCLKAAARVKMGIQKSESCKMENTFRPSPSWFLSHCTFRHSQYKSFSSFTGEDNQ